jgi:hypothetical protein
LFFKAGEQVGHDQNSQDTVACTTALKTSSTALISLALLVSCYDVVVAQGDCSRVEADADRFCKALFFLKVWLQIVFIFTAHFAVHPGENTPQWLRHCGDDNQHLLYTEYNTVYHLFKDFLCVCPPSVAFPRGA